MSVLIKGMEMPKCCLYCRFSWGGDSTTYCTAQRDIDNYGRETLHHIKFTYHGYDEQQSWREETCPLVEVPPHGRLIDADALNGKMYHNAFETDSDMQKWDSGCWVRYKMFENNLRDAPTIIGAEGEENG